MCRGGDGPCCGGCLTLPLRQGPARGATARAAYAARSMTGLSLLPKPMSAPGPASARQPTRPGRDTTATHSAHLDGPCSTAELQAVLVLHPLRDRLGQQAPQLGRGAGRSQAHHVAVGNDVEAVHLHAHGRGRGRRCGSKAWAGPCPGGRGGRALVLGERNQQPRPAAAGVRRYGAALSRGRWGHARAFCTAGGWAGGRAVWQGGGGAWCQCMGTPCNSLSEHAEVVHCGTVLQRGHMRCVRGVHLARGQPWGAWSQCHMCVGDSTTGHAGQSYSDASSSAMPL